MPSTLITAGDSTNSLVATGGNDNTLTLQSGPVGAKVNGITIASDGTPTFLKVPLNTALQSMVRVNTANGYGSTNTVIRRFTNIVTNQGVDITYADSATLGGSFTINTAGVYAINFTSCTSAASDIGVSLNSAQLTTSIITITTSAILTQATVAAANFTTCVATTVYLPASSVIRAHTDGITTGTGRVDLFTITRVA